jgi:hypothetical protein
MNFTSQELLLSIDDFASRILEPAMSVLAANIEADALSMYKDVPYLYDGDAAALTFTSIATSRQMLTDQLAPSSQRTLLLNTTHSTKFQIDTKGLFHSSEAITQQYRDGKVGQTQGFENIFENNLLTPHQTGTCAKTTSYTVNGATQSGSTITIQTGTNTLLKGDVVTFAGCNDVHPETKVSTGVLKKFVVTANLSAAGALSIWPALTISGPRQNCSGYPTDSGAVVKVGAGASETLVQSLAYHKNAFAFVTADLPMPNGVDFASRQVVDGISVSLVRDFSISDRSVPCRLDVLYGYKAVRPQLAVRIHNDG